MTIKLVTAAAAGVVGLGCVFHIIGLATPEWVAADGGSIGLWKTCYQGECVTIKEDGKPDWFKACDALAVLGILFGLAAFTIAAVMVVMEALNKPSPRAVGAAVLATSIVSFSLIIICVILFAVKIGDDASVPAEDFGYSFRLSISGACLILIGGIIAAILKFRYTGYQSL